MFSQAFTLFGLLALTSAGLLTPSNVYLPVPSTQQQTNTLTRSSHTIHVPAAVTSSHQIPAVSSAIYQQTPAVSSAIHQQTPAVRNNAVNTAHFIYTAGVPAVASSFFQQNPQSAQQVTVHDKSSQPIQIQQANVPSVYQQALNTASYQVPSIRQTNFGTQQVTSTVNANTLHSLSQPAHTNAAAIPFLKSAAFQQVPIRQIAIVRLANENVGDGTYSYNYETENGISAEEHGQANVAGADTVERVQGSYSYTGPDGVRYTINYVADENGYRADGAHLPVPPEPVASVSQVTSRTSQINSNVVGSQSAGVHVIPTTVISQPIQIVQNPGVQSQRQATNLRTSYYQQSPVFHSSQNIFRQASVVPSSTLSVYHGSTTNQQVSADSQHNQSHEVPSSITVHHGSTGSSSLQSDAVQTQVIQKQSTVVPNTVYVQNSAPSHHVVSEAFQHGILRQNTVVPATTVSVQHGSTGYSTQQRDAVQTPVLQQQSTVVPNTVYVQNSAPSHHVVSEAFQHGILRQNTVVPATTVSVQHGSTGYSTQQRDAVQTQVLQRQSTVVPNTVTVQNSAVSSNAVSGAVQHGNLRQSAVIVPASTVSVQHGTSGHSTQQIGVGSFNAQLGGLQRQFPQQIVQQGAEYNTQHSGQQTFQTQQDVVQNQNKVSFGFVSAQQGTNSQHSSVQNLGASSNADSVQQGTASEQSGVVSVVQSQSTAVPSSTVSIQRGLAVNNVYGSVQQNQAAVPTGIVPVHLGRTGLIKQRNSVQAQQNTGIQHESSGVSSSHVTVQLGTAGYATEQVGDVSSVQVFGGSSHESASLPTQTLTNVQQVSQQAGVSSNVVPATVSEQQNSGSNHETTVSQGVVLPDGSVHHGY